MFNTTTSDPGTLPAEDLTIGLPRLVCETHARLGPDATPDDVATDLKTRGIDTCVEDVK